MAPLDGGRRVIFQADKMAKQLRAAGIIVLLVDVVVESGGDTVMVAVSRDVG